MNSFYNEMERNTKSHVEAGLEVIEKYHGITFDVLEERKSVHTDVYGTSASGELEKIGIVEGFIINNDLVPIGDIFSGTFEDGIFITRSEDSLVGKTLRIKRIDGKVRSYRIKEVEGIGFTLQVFKQFKINPIAD